MKYHYVRSTTFAVLFSMLLLTTIGPTSSNLIAATRSPQHGQRPVVAQRLAPSASNVSPNDGIWQPVTSPTTNFIGEIAMINSDTGWAVGSSGTILQYINGHWISAASPTP